MTMQARYFVAEVPLPDPLPDEPHAVRPTSAQAATAAVINFFINYLLIRKGSATLRGSPTGSAARLFGSEHGQAPLYGSTAG
jgi:hypothetical protein